MTKKESLPAHLQEKDSRGDDHLTLYERHEKPIACRSRPSLSSPRSTNDIVRAFSCANPTLLRSATNCVLTCIDRFNLNELNILASLHTLNVCDVDLFIWGIGLKFSIYPNMKFTHLLT